MTLLMYDSITPANLPAGAAAYAGYTSGAWPDFDAIRARFPRAHVLAVAVSASRNAECLDVENGDASAGQAPGWVKRQHARGQQRPCVYASVSRIAALWDLLKAAGISRGQVRLWSAHYGHGPHICGPASCGQSPVGCDGTQWTDQAAGTGSTHVDESILSDGFFSEPAAAAVKKEPVMILLGTGKTPVAIPAGVTRLQFVAEDKRTVDILWHGGKTQKLELSWPDGSVFADVPPQVGAAVLDVSGLGGHVALSFGS